MSRQQEIERAVEHRLHEAADRMDVDLEAAASRLARRVAGVDRTRRRARVAVLVAAAVLVVAAAVVGRTVGGRDGSGSSLFPATQDQPPGGRPYLLDLETGTTSPLPRAVLPDPYTSTFSLKVSPDGQWIAYTACLVPTGGYWGCARNDGAQGAVMRIDGSDRVELPLGERQTVGDVVWSSDGRRLAYQVIDPRLPGQRGEEFGVGELYVFDRTTGRSTRASDIDLEKSDWWLLMYSFGADGTSLVYDLPRGSGPNTPWDVWSVPVDGGAARRLIDDARAPEVLRNGSGIAYVVPIRASWAGSSIRIREPSGTDREVAAADVAVEWLQSSPDGSRLAFQDQGRTFVADLRDGAVLKVADTIMYGWADAHTLVLGGPRETPDRTREGEDP